MIGNNAKSANLIDMKVAESEYFLHELKNSKIEFLIINSIVNAFVSSCRNITFSIQFILKNTEGFSIWYKKKQEYMKNNILFIFFNEYRRLSIHEAQYYVRHATSEGGEALWYFDDIKSIHFSDNVYVICTKYFTELLELVLDCYHEFKFTLSGRWYYSQENFKRMNKTIIDAETELGYPPNWTKVTGSKKEFHKRWDALRRNVIGCEINHLFKNYLKKYFQEP